MRKHFSTIMATGFAIFSMFFGAGNVVFPLFIGRQAGDKNFYAILGLLITAVGVPFLGLVAMVLFNGDYKKFFYRLGKVPGSLAILLSMSIIGPLGAIPRCIALSYSTVKSFLPFTNLFYFSIISCIILYILASNKCSIIDILGKILSPILLVSLSIIIVKGFWGSPSAVPMKGSGAWFFLDGLVQGYSTLDIFAGFFFSGIVINALRNRCSAEKVNEKFLASKTLSAGIMGVSLLGIIYAGFSYVSSFYARSLAGVGKDSLISQISYFTLGKYAGVLACVAVSLACLTTAIALSVVLAGYIKEELFKNKVSYKFALLLNVVVTFAFANIGFAGIMKILVPILIVCYPAFIVLAVMNILHKVYGVKLVKAPVFATLAIALVYNLVK